MDRRTYLATIGSLPIIGLAGCGETTPSNHIADSDPPPATTERTPPQPNTDTQPQESATEHTNTIQANYRPLTDLAPAYFTDYALQKSTLEYTKSRLEAPNIDDTAKLAITARRYPDGPPLDIDTTPPKPIQTGTNRLELTHDLAVPDATPFYLTATAYPPQLTYQQATRTHRTTPICETDRLLIQNAHLKKDRLLTHPQSETTIGFTRITGEGTFIVIIDTEMSPFGTTVFKHPYFVMNNKRPERTADAIHDAIRDGRASELARFLHAEARTRHHTDPQTQLQYAIRVIQNIPTTQTPSAEFDTNAKYPIETLVEGHGDSEDTTILLGAILAESPFDYDVAILKFPPQRSEHVALGVANPPGPTNNPPFTAGGTQYHCIDTTKPGKNIGEPPTGYSKTTASITPI